MKYTKFFTVNLGCKVNAYELDCIKQELLENGLKESKTNPEIIIINTCAVTHMAGHKSKQKISSFRTKFPKAIIVAIGCFIEEKKNDKNAYEKADIVLGNNDKFNCLKEIQNFIKNKKQICLFSDVKKSYQEYNSFSHNTRQRTYLKIEDGCTNFCSYCLIPYLRKGIQSRDKEKIFKEVEFLRSKNVKEIVLSGIHVGMYGLEKKDKYYFGDLLKDLLAKFPTINFRLSSLEISEVGDDFFKLFKTYKNLMPYLHIPLQSGSDKVLKDMNRKYSSKDYLESIKKARKINPNICISSDVIVGFPTEGNKEFEESLKTIKEANISFLHVFPFSSREGTQASKLKDLSPEIKKERSNKLLKLSNTLMSNYQKSLIGKETNVLLEKYDSKTEFFYGTSDEYLEVKVKGKFKIGDYINLTYNRNNF